MSVVFLESNEQELLQQMLVDETCRKLYQEIQSICLHQPTHLQEGLLSTLVKQSHDHYLTLYYLGWWYGKHERDDAATACYQACVKQYPLTDAYLNWAIICCQHDHLEQARQLIQTAHEHNPHELRILNFLGALYYAEKDYYQAMEYYSNLIEDPGMRTSFSMKNVYNNLGFSCTAIGKWKKAIGYFDRGLQIKCDPRTHSAVQIREINIQLLQNKLINYDYMMELPKGVWGEYLRISDLFQIPKGNRDTVMPPRSRPKSHQRKIKVGYLSPDLRHHVVSFFMLGILRYFNRQQFDVYCYANVKHEDGMSQYFKQLSGIVWTNIDSFNATQVAEIIHQHQIDILIDLAGHTDRNRLDVMALKPAPIQVTYLGFPNTTGLKTIDYRITDHFADPKESQQKYTEQLVYMPRCFVCYTPSISLDQFPIQTRQSRPGEPIVFGVMNKINKHNKWTFRAWREILQRVPGGILLIKRDLKGPDALRIKYLLKIGVDSQRVRIVDHLPQENDYYRLYNQIDICLDTFPYSGTTTSCDGFMMGTPIVTYQIPNRHVSSVTTSMLINLGCPELVTHSIDEYIQVAVDLARSPERIATYKRTLRQRFMEVMDPVKFAAEFDHLLVKLVK